MSGWGPSHQQAPAKGAIGWRWAGRLALPIAGFLVIGRGSAKNSSVEELIGFGLWALALLPYVMIAVGRRLQAPRRSGRRSLLSRSRAGREPQAINAADQLTRVRQYALRSGGGAYLGFGEDRRARYARAERATLLLGPPRAGKTSAVIIPSLIAHTGPAVSTSTKADVAAATLAARSRGGRAWAFDPTGKAASGPAGMAELRWSPIVSSHNWDGALLMARAMTARLGVGTTDRSHWASRAQALLAPLLHAAAVHHRDMDAVVDWVMSHDLDDAGVLLEDERCSKLAFTTLLGIHHTEARERSSIFSATADALAAYTSENALAAAREPNFDTDAFVRSADTVYIHAPAEAQAAAAPIVCGLLSEIRRATYAAFADGQLPNGRVLFALDEAANIAPLEELPQMASEGGGQGLVLIAAFQDLSQARQRWGVAADGFLTLFGTKLILGGIADSRTLESISQMLGEYDRQVVSRTEHHRRLFDDWNRTPRPSSTVSTQRTRVLSPGDVANIPAGRALHLDGVTWELVSLTPAHRSNPWHTIIAG